MTHDFSILVADRNKNVREFLRRELGADGYQVQTAKDGREVLDLVNGEGPDLLILDLEIPFIDGLSILQKLKARPRALPVVIYSFLTEQTDHPAMQYAEAFVEKGGDLDRLKSVVVKVLEKAYPKFFAES